MPTPKHPATPWTGTKRSFIASMSSSMPNEIVAAGKEYGLKLTLAHVYAVRSLERRQKKQAKSPKKNAKAALSGKPGPAARSPRRRRARPSRRSSPVSNRVAEASAASASGRGASGRRGPRSAGHVDADRKMKSRVAMDMIYENTLRAAATMLGFPRAMQLLESEQRRLTNIVFGPAFS